jgi:DNA-binding CsgD family transcriptional regulator
MSTDGDQPIDRRAHPLMRVSEGMAGDDGLLAAVSGPALLLDVYGFILGGNIAGQELVERHPAFLIERGYLALRRQHEAWSLADAVLEASRGAGNPVHLTLFSRSGRPVLLMRLVGVGFGAAETIMITIEDLLSRIEDINRLSAAMGLGAEQTRTAAMLAHGMNEPEIALLLGVGEDIVREHVRSAMQRLGLNGQRELMVCTLRMARFLGLMETVPPARPANNSGAAHSPPSGSGTV